MPAGPAPARLASFPRPRAVSAALRPRLPDYLPARMLNEFVYCPRLFHYEWVEGVFAHSADTVEGALRHATVDGPAGGLPKVDEATGAPIHSRSVTLSSETHGLIAVLDLVEGEGDRVSPVCLPDETAAVASASEGAVTQPSLFDEAGGDAPVPEARGGEIRRLVPARDDLRPLYVTGHGLTLGRKDERLQVRDGKKVVQGTAPFTPPPFSLLDVSADEDPRPHRR